MKIILDIYGYPTPFLEPPADRQAIELEYKGTFIEHFTMAVFKQSLEIGVCVNFG